VKSPAKKHVTHERGTTYVRMPLIAAAGLILALAFMTVLFWSATRERRITMRVENPGELKTLIPSLVSLTQGALEEGNAVEVTQNGDGFFPLLLRDIAAARESIHVETYIWWDGKFAHEFAAALAKKAREGIEVRVLVDASGGRAIRKVRETLESAGVKVATFHPIRFSNLGRLNNRDHRKIWIIDGRVAFVGGYGIADEWTGHAQNKKRWRDTGLRITGPLVNHLQGAFCENWIEETGEILAGDRYFPRIADAGRTTAHVAYTSPSGGPSSVQVLYYLAIKAARREILIQNPYLLPDRQAIAALEDAVKRGVDVRIMVPADDATDSPIVQHASHHHFGTMLKRGIKLYEYKPTLLHQKIIVVDGLWSCVGSTNFDDRSFQLNDEISVGIVDAGVAAQLRAAFANDLRQTRQRQFGEWQARSLWHKLVDGLAHLGRSQL